MASPFQPNQGPSRGQPPPNFKTNVNRNKTKKWIEAKGYSYDGDDWGEYDETDEYGVEQDHPESVPQLPPQQLQQQQQRVTGLRQAGQSAGGASNGGRNFTDPSGAPPQGIQRQQSFDVGDERRAFSTGVGQGPPGQLPGIPQGAPLHVDTELPPAAVHRVDTSSSHYPSAGGLASSSEGTPYSANPAHRRDFSPSAMPPPLHPEMGPGDPQLVGDASSAARGRPPRKSSLSQIDPPVVTDVQVPAEEETSRQRAPSNPKPLPFIRPADIYKRMEEEKARERASSQDSGRPSLDSLRPNEELRGTPSKKSSSESLPSVQEERTGTPASQRKPMLPTVAEGQPIATSNPPVVANAGRQDFLPPSETSPSFSDEFEQFTSPQSRHPPPEAQMELQHQPSLGFRSVVEQAFDRPGAEKAAPSTTTSGSLRSTDPSDMSRSNTDSTAGISPIMSRVPSVGVAAAARASHQQHEAYDHNRTPTIAEEPVDSSRPTSATEPPAPSTPRKLEPSHSREPSAESAFIPGYRRQDTPPSRGSPARTPNLEHNRGTPEPHVAHLAASVSGPDATHREADVADALHTRPDSPVKSRSQSPSKGRVSQLAGRFDDIAEASSRRNSSHSVASRESWEVDSRKSWAAGPEQLQVQRAASPAPADASLRPKLPGQWESFATDRPDSESAAPRVGNEALPADRAAETELEPTTARSTLRSSEVHDEKLSITQNPIAALTAAGAAIGESLRSTVGMNHETKEAAPEESARGGQASSKQGQLAVGDIVSRPGALRAQSALSNNTSIPPTPPPKDHDPLNPPVPLKGQEYAPAQGPTVQNQFSAAQVPSSMGGTRGGDLSDDEDDVNDKLSKDIVRSLSPEKDRIEDQGAPTDVPGNRESNFLPSEYGYYWGAPDNDAGHYAAGNDFSEESRGVELTRPDPAIIEETHRVARPPSNRPNFLDNRFSWEQDRNSVGFSSFTGLGTGENTTATSTGLAVPDHEHQPSHGSDAPEVIEPVPEPVEPSATVDDLPRQSLDRSTSPVPTGLHIVNVRGAEEAVDVPPRLKTPEPQSENRASRDGASSAEAPTVSVTQDGPAEQGVEPVSEYDFAGPPQPAVNVAPASSLTPAAEITSPTTDSSKPRIPPFRELAAIPNPRERIKAYDSTREQFAKTDTGLQGWLAQTIAANPEHSHLLKGGQPFPIDTRTVAHRTSPSVTKFSNILSPTTPQQTQSPDAVRPAQGPSPGASHNPSGSTSLGAQKGKELLQNAGVLGGKVGQGAKGLFAKGRNKLRAASGSDKVSTPISATAASNATPTPPHSLSRASTQPLEQSRSIEQPTPTRPRSSHFRRFSSRPSSMAVSEAETIPEVPTEPLPPGSRRSTPDNRSTASGLSISKRRMSPFRRRPSRPSSAVTDDSMYAVPEIPKEPLPIHQRSATFGGMLASMRSREDEDKSKLKGLKRLSAFMRTSKPDTAPPPTTIDNAQFSGGFPKNLTYSGDRRASYAFGSTLPMPPATIVEQRRASVAVGAARAALPPVPDIFGGPEQLEEAQNTRPPSQLGILPSPTRDSFGLSRAEPPSPTADEDMTPRAAQFDPSQTMMESQPVENVPNAMEELDLQPPTRRGTQKSRVDEENEARQSRLIESVVRHASPPLKDIESRRQSRVGIEPDTTHLPLPNMGSVSGAPSPNTEKSDPLSSKPSSPAAQVSPPTLPKVEIPKSYSIKEGKMPAREEMVPSPEPPLPPAGAGVIPTSPVDRVDGSRQFASVDRNLSVTSKSSEAVSALEVSPELRSEEEKGGAQSTSVSREISSASTRPDLDDSKLPVPRPRPRSHSPVSREASQRKSWPDVSPISDEDRESKATLGPIQAVTYGERKPDWLDSDEEDMETPMQQTQPRVQSSVPVPYGQMDKEITIEPISRTSTEDDWDKVSHEETPRDNGTETREGWHTPSEDLLNDDEEVEINEAGTASSGHIRQISDIAKLNRESMRIKAEAVEAARASALQEPLPNDPASTQQSTRQGQPDFVAATSPPGQPVVQEPVENLHHESAGAVLEDVPPPVPPKSPGPAVPARQSPFGERTSGLAPPQDSPQRGHLQRPSFGDTRPLSFQMLPRPASGSVPQEQINVAQPQAYSPPQVSPLASPARARPPIPQQRDYSQVPDSAQTQVSPDGDSPRSAGLRRTSGPIQPAPPSEHVRQKSIDRLSHPMQSAGTEPQNNPMVSRSVDPRMFQSQPFPRQSIDPRQQGGAEYQGSGVGPPPQTRESRALPIGFMKGMSKQPPPAPLEQQQFDRRSPQATSPQDPRRSAFQPSGSPLGSPDDRKTKKSGFFGNLRPSSSGADTVLTADSMQAQPSSSPVRTTKIHYLSDIERQQAQAAASGKLSKADKRVERAQSSGDLAAGKKKRFSSLTGLFGRSGTTGHTPPSRAIGSGKKLQKINEQKTPSPAQGQPLSAPPFPQPYPQQQTQQPLTRTFTGPASAYQEQAGAQPNEEVVIPPGGFYAPENNGFVAGQGPRGYSPMSQQANDPYSPRQGQPTLPNVEDPRVTTYINGGQHSPPPHRWRHPDQSSPPVAPVYQAPTRHMSAGMYAPTGYTPSPPPARHVSAPGHSHMYGHLRPQHAPRMPSVGEDGRHQERPWAIQLPQGPPDPENDAHRRDSIQYAMMVRQQMAQQQTILEHQSPQAAYQAQQLQYVSPPQSQTFHSHGQPPYDMPTYPTPGGHHPQGRYSEIRDSQAPVLTLDPAAIARIKLEAQERTRQQALEAQRLQQQQEEEFAMQQRPYTAPDDENSLYAPPTRPQTALSPQHSTPPPPLPSQYVLPPLPPPPQQAGGYDQRIYQQYAGREAVPHAAEPHHYPLPTSPSGTVASPIDPLAGQMSPPPLPALPQPPPQPPSLTRPSEDPNSKAVGFGAHRNFPSDSSIVAPPPPYQSTRASADDRMDVPSETLMRTERRTEELRSQIQARRHGQDDPGVQQRQQQPSRRVDDDEPVVMHAASYPGMEWEPRWEE